MNKEISKKTTIIIIAIIVLAIVLYILLGVINLPDVIRAKNDTWLHETAEEIQKEKENTTQKEQYIVTVERK